MSGIFGNGTQQTTQNTQAKPYGPAKPLLKAGLQDAMKLYRSGVGSKTYTGSTVVPFSQQTTGAMDDIMRGANANMGGQGLSGQMQGIINNGGFNAGQMDALKNFQQTANSSYDMNANPGFQSVLQKMQNDARNQVGMSASAAGRYGSGIAQGAVAREVGNVTDRMVSDDFNRWLGRKDSANQNMFNANQTGLANMQGAYNAMQDPAKAAMGVGSMYEDLYKRQIDDQLRLFNDKQNAPWDFINKALGTANMSAPYAPKSLVSQSPSGNPFLSAIGGVAGTYGLAKESGLLGLLGV